MLTDRQKLAVDQAILDVLDRQGAWTNNRFAAECVVAIDDALTIEAYERSEHRALREAEGR